MLKGDTAVSFFAEWQKLYKNSKQIVMNSRPSQQKKTFFVVINSTLFNELFQLIKTYFLVSLAPAFWMMWMSKIHNCNYFSQIFWTKMLSGCFSLWSPKFCYCYCYKVIWSSFSTCKSCYCWGPNIFRPNSQKSARNLNLYNFCHSAKKTNSGITL
jgi:hypothetical protein